MADVFGFNELKAAFFDTDAVMRAVKAAERKVLSKMGAFIRTRARSSIRKRKATSAPGQPPSSHEGSLKRLIFFAYDAQRNSVVIGPVQFKQGTAPKLLEFGGETTRRYKSGAMRRMKYHARPFMAPAGKAEAPKFQELLKNMVR
jgi:hypothetical protein